MNPILHCTECFRKTGEIIYYAHLQSQCVVCKSVELRPLESSEQDLKIPGVNEVLRDPAASRWLKEALQMALRRDPVDAANDAEVLALILDRRVQMLLKEAGEKLER